MANSKCPTCKEESGFESVLENVNGANRQFVFVRCSNCKTAISVFENVAVENSLNNIQATVMYLKEKVDLLLKR